jgi:dephospho-CoA kinase
MTTVLVTGPIGGGKSTVCSYLAAAGMPVYECDSRCKALYSEVPGLKGRIEKELEIPFAELGRVFETPDKLAKLEAIVYPLLLADLEAWKAAQTGPLAFVESAIALEKPLFRHVWDKVLMVTAPAHLRLLRNPAAARRDAFQHYDNSLIDYTIDNDSDLESLFAKVDYYLESL